MGNTNQKSTQVANLTMSCMQSLIQDAQLNASTTQDSSQAINVTDSDCWDTIYIDDIDMENTMGASTNGSATVTQTSSQDASMVEDMTQAITQGVQGITTGSTSQSSYSELNEYMQATQYTSDLTTADCTISQSSDQVINITGSTSENCTVQTVSMGDTMDAVNTCSLDAVQTATETLDMDESGDQESSQTVSGIGGGLGILFLIVLGCIAVIVLLVWAFLGTIKKIVETGTDTFFQVLPFLFIGGGVILLGLAIYQFGWAYPANKANYDSAYYPSDESLDDLEKDKLKSAPGIVYALQTASNPGLVVNEKIFSSKDFSTQYSPLLTGDTSSFTRIQQIFGTTPNITNSLENVCGQAELRYVFTSYDFGQEEVTRCDKNSSSDDVTCSDDMPWAQAGFIRLTGQRTSGDDTTYDYSGKESWKNWFVEDGWSILTSNGWCKSDDQDGAGTLQDFRFGSGADGSDSGTVIDTLTRAIPWMTNHASNNSDSSSNFNVAIFVAPYGADHYDCDASFSSGGTFTDHGYAPNTCQPPFYYILCYSIASSSDLATCKDSIGGDESSLSTAAQDCASCTFDGTTSTSDCCDDFFTQAEYTLWHAGNLSNSVASDTGPVFIQTNAKGILVNPIQDDGTPSTTSDGLQPPVSGGAQSAIPNPSSDYNYQGGYYLSSCNANVASNVEGCQASSSSAFNSQTSNTCCRPFDCGTDDWTDPFYDGEGNLAGPIGKLYPTCYSSGMVLCVDRDTLGTANLCEYTSAKSDSPTGPLPYCDDVHPYSMKDGTTADDDTLNAQVQLNILAKYDESGTTDTGVSYQTGDYVYGFLCDSSSSSGEYTSSLDDFLQSDIISNVCSTGTITANSYSCIATSAVDTFAFSEPVTDLSLGQDLNKQLLFSSCYTGFTTSDVSGTSLDDVDMTVTTTGFNTSTGTAGVPQVSLQDAYSSTNDDGTVDSATQILKLNQTQAAATADQLHELQSSSPTAKPGLYDYDSSAMSTYIPLFNICGLSGIPGLASDQTFDCKAGYGGNASESTWSGKVTTFAEAADRMCGGSYEQGIGLAPQAVPLTAFEGAEVAPWQNFMETKDLDGASCSDTECTVPVYETDDSGAITSLWAACYAHPNCDSGRGNNGTVVQQVNYAGAMVPTFLVMWENEGYTYTSQTTTAGMNSYQLSLFYGGLFSVTGILCVAMGASMAAKNKKQNEE